MTCSPLLTGKPDPRPVSAKPEAGHQPSTRCQPLGTFGRHQVGGESYRCGQVPGLDLSPQR